MSFELNRARPGITHIRDAMGVCMTLIEGEKAALLVDTGYGTEDVSAFMEHKDTGCKCVGFWKVYGDEQAAQKTFARYRKCSAAYYRQWKKGKPFDRLIITS